MKGSVQYFLLQNLVLDAELHFMQFKLDHLNEVYYKPVVQTTIGAKYSFIGQKIKSRFQRDFCVRKND